MTQPSFSFAAPVVKAADIQRLIDALAAGEWRTYQQLKGSLKWSDRKLRAVANASGGRVVSGNGGYKLTVSCTPAEFNEFQWRMASQESAMKQRRLEAERVWHARQVEAA